MREIGGHSRIAVRERTRSVYLHHHFHASCGVLQHHASLIIIQLFETRYPSEGGTRAVSEFKNGYGSAMRVFANMVVFRLRFLYYYYSSLTGSVSSR